MTPGAKIRIVLVDDHRVVTGGLKRLLDDCDDMRVVGVAASHLEALAEVGKHKPDVILLDIRMPGADGFETCRVIKKDFPATKALILTSVKDDGMILEAIRSGADGYLLKEIDIEQLAAGIRQVAAGGALFDPDATRGIIRELDQRQPGESRNDRLTAREQQLLRGVAQGKTNRQISEEFGLSEGTVRNYLSVIFEKMGVARRSQAVAEYLKRGN